MDNDTFQPQAPVKIVRFQLRERWLYAASYGIGLPFLGAFIVFWLSLLLPGWIRLAASLFIVATMAFGLVRFVWVVETRQEGLYLRGMLGITQIIPWQEIRRIAYQRERSGRVLFVGSSSLLQAKAVIIVSMFSTSDAIPEPVNNLISSIADAAHLTLVKQLPFGGKVYERQQISPNPSD